MSKISTLGIDLAKNNFQLCAMDKYGKVIFNRKLHRSKVLELVLNLDIEDDFHIAMETCPGSNYWGQTFSKHNFTVKLIAPKFVKPYVKSNKNDYHDAEAIAEASRRPTMRFVGVKSVEQQDIKAIHNIRESLIKRRTCLSNEIRGILFEYGIVITKGIHNTRKSVPLILDDSKNQLSITVREIVSDLYQELLEIFSRVEKYDKKIQSVYKENEVCKRIGKVEGVGFITATAIFAAVGNPHVFKNGREFASWLGLTPKQCSTGGKNNLLGISKRGDGYIRKNLVHGCRAVTIYADKKTDKKSRWVTDKIQRRGRNKAAVALANKNARVIWSLLAHGSEYKVSGAA